ncbi:hypothetical protein [Aureimonas psammosilenae]|uniref:hypothetical protein n=1 Tax=Aureimonas psammosilenae TaxID=2495496 RepID=UPI00126091D9|nr:hypothetical protein [Aureimonas psammosilenae]
MPHDVERNPILIADAAALSAMAEALSLDRLRGRGLILTDVLAIGTDSSMALAWFHQAGGTITWTIEEKILDLYRRGQMPPELQARHERYHTPLPSRRAVREYMESLEPANVDAVTIAYADRAILVMLRSADVPIQSLTVEEFINSTLPETSVCDPRWAKA